MEAIEIKKNGGPEVLELKDIKLEDPKEGEVLIKHSAIGLNYIDTLSLIHISEPTRPY